MNSVPVGVKGMIMLWAFWTWLWKNTVRAFIWAFVVLVSAELMGVEVTARVMWLLCIAVFTGSMVDSTIFPTPSNLPWKKRR